MAIRAVVLVKWDALFFGALVTEVTTATIVLVSPTGAVLCFFVLRALVCCTGTTAWRAGRCYAQRSNDDE